MKLISIILIGFLTFACSRPAITESNTLENFSATEELPAETDLSLEMQFAEIAKEAKGKVGVATVEIETGRAAHFNQNERFAMQSVVKLPISMAVLRQYGEGKRDLDNMIMISKDEYVPSNMRSPLRDAKTTEISVRELIRYAISESDGTAADVLQRVAGGAAGVQSYIDSLGIDQMKVKYSHKEFAKQWEFQYENWSTPASAIDLLRWLHKSSEALGPMEFKMSADGGMCNCPSPKEWNLRFNDLRLIVGQMRDSSPGPDRLKGLLPKDAVVAHKTGTGGTRDGVTSATNDVGIITMPNGNHVAIAVFVGDSSADEKTRAGVIAKIAKAVWDRWTE